MKVSKNQSLQVFGIIEPQTLSESAKFALGVIIYHGDIYEKRKGDYNE